MRKANFGVLLFLLVFALHWTWQLGIALSFLQALDWQPFWETHKFFLAGFVGYFFLGEKFKTSWIIGGMIGLLGISFLAGIFEELSVGPYFMWGVFCGLATAPFYTGYLFYIRQSQTLPSSPSTATCYVLFFFSPQVFQQSSHF